MNNSSFIFSALQISLSKFSESMDGTGAVCAGSQLISLRLLPSSETAISVMELFMGSNVQCG